MTNTQNANTPNPCRVVVLARISYAHVWEPSAMANDPNGKKKYSVTLLIPKTDQTQIAKISAAITAAYNLGMTETNPKKSLRNVNSATMQKPLKDADVDPKKKDDTAYKGHYFLSAKSDSQPVILDESKNTMMDKAKLYSGCFCYVAINFFPFNNIQAGIGCGLNHIMKAKDGEALAGVESADQAFADIPAAGVATGAAMFGQQPAVQAGGFNPFV